MLLHAAILPPRHVVEAVVAVLESVVVPVEVEVAQAPRGVLGRFGRKTGPTVPAPAPMPLDLVPPDRRNFPVTGFGNLTTGDSHRLADAISAAAEEWSPIPVRFAGGAALEFPGDWSVWAKLEGDLDRLAKIASGVTSSVESLGFFVDRRIFRPMLSLATVTPDTTGPYLEAVVDALDAFRGEEWVIDHVALTTEVFTNGKPEFKEVQRIPLAG